MKRNKPLILTLAVLGVSLASVAVSGAAVIRVPQEQSNIQSAINAAAPGDTVAVDTGTYYAANMLVNKPITITSVNGPAATIIDSQSSGRGFIVQGGSSDWVNIVGFTIQNSTIPRSERGGALKLSSGKCKLYKCIVQGVVGAGDYGGGPVSNDSTSRGDLIVDTCIVRNNFGANGAAVGGATVINSWLYSNTAGNNCGALWECDATNVTVYGNGGGYLPNQWTVGGAIGSSMKNCILWNNLPSYNDQQVYQSSSVTYCIVMNGYDGTGNLSSDPMFFDALAGDFRLQPGSPALGAGDPSITKPDGSRSDIGASGDLNSGFPISFVCTPHAARATAVLFNGFVVGADIIDSGCGYTSPPLVLIQGGGGTGATATATLKDGSVSSISITSAGSGYTTAPKIVIASPPFVPTVEISVSRVKVTQKVALGRNYILESSSDGRNWSDAGSQFTADSEVIVSEFPVEGAVRFFRLKEMP